MTFIMHIIYGSLTNREPIKINVFSVQNLGSTQLGYSLLSKGKMMEETFEVSLLIYCTIYYQG